MGFCRFKKMITTNDVVGEKLLPRCKNTMVSGKVKDGIDTLTKLV